MDSTGDMQIELWFDARRQVAVSRYSGTLTLPGMMRERQMLAAHGGIDRVYHRLVDARLLEAERISTLDMTRVASTTVPSDVAKRALLADNDMIYGLANMYRAQSEHIRPFTEVFRELSAALAWLDLPDDYLDRLGPPDLVFDDTLVTPERLPSES